jgi:hypothetical protein
MISSPSTSSIDSQKLELNFLRLFEGILPHLIEETISENTKEHIKVTNENKIECY